MHNRDEVNSFFDDHPEFDSEDLDLALRELVAKGLVELHFDGKEFCFSVTNEGIDFADQIRENPGTNVP
jgi:predicted MarR family transcription regulator